MGEPPLFTGAAQETLAEAFPGTAVTFVGGSGSPRGVTARDGALAGESPLEFVATTVNV